MCIDGICTYLVLCCDGNVSISTIRCISSLILFLFWSNIIWFRFNLTVKGVYTFLIFMIHSTNCWFCIRQRIIRMWWCQVRLSSLTDYRSFSLQLSSAYSDRRLNVLFFLVFVVIGNTYDWWIESAQLSDMSVSMIV